MGISEINIDDFQFICAECNNTIPDGIASYEVQEIETSTFILGCPSHNQEIGVGISEDKITLMDTKNIRPTEEEIFEAILEKVKKDNL